jgi:cytochrome P450
MRRLQDLPGPPPSLILGNLPQLQPARVHQMFEEWAKQYGKEFLVCFGKIPVLVLSEHETISQVLRDRPDAFSRTKRTSQIGREMGLTPGLFSSEGDAWRNQRRMVMASFSPTQIRAYFPSMVKVTHRLRARWERAAANSTAIELQDDLMRYTVDTITGLAFGQDVNTLEADDNVIQEHLNTIFPAIARRSFAIVPYWRFFKFAADRQLDRSVAHVNQAIAGFIHDARQRLQNAPARRGNPPNLLESFIVSAEQENGKITDADITGNVLTMLLSGEDTTANTMAWMLYLLLSNPETLARVQQEVRTVMQGHEEFTPELLASMDFLDACVHETMRLKPVAPFLPVQALKDLTVGDIAVPKDSLIWTVLRHDSVDEAHFPNANSFNPARWLGPQTPGTKGISMPFGSGPRMCPGRYLAMLEIKLCIGMLLQCFDVLSVATPSGQSPVEKMNFTMTPEDLFMRLAVRPQADLH